jgi:hypothetical protein
VESGLCSSSSDFHALSKKFVCVRLYYTLEGASEPFAKLGLGNPARPDANFNLGKPGEVKRNNVDVAFLDPDGRPIHLFRLRPDAKPALGASALGCWVRDLPGGEAAGNGTQMVRQTIELMREISKLHPGKEDALVIPWQVSLAHAIFVSAWDNPDSKRGWGRRDSPRIVVAPAQRGKVDPGVERSLGDPDVLKKHGHRYVFVRLEPGKAPPEWAEAFERAGAEGLMIVEDAQTVNGFGQRQVGVPRTYPKVLEAMPGPLTKTAVMELLDRCADPGQAK